MRHKYKRLKGYKDKAASQTLHAKRRALERFGIRLSDKGVAELIQTIQSNGAQFVRRESNRVAVYRMEIDGASALVVYDRSRKTIVTVMRESKNVQNG